MAEAYKYTALLCSLPACQELFSAKFTPISRIQLDTRLRVMDEADHQDIELLGEILDWFRHPLIRTDAELLTLAEKKRQQINSPSVVDYLDWRLEFRTLISAMRQKHRGLTFDANEKWGYGPWVLHVNRHWNENYFGLEKIFPWLVDIARLLESEQAMELERYTLRHVWQWLEKEAFGHEFDLEAVVIYRMRWDLVARWTSYVKEPAQLRFASLLDAAFEAA